MKDFLTRAGLKGARARRVFLLLFLLAGVFVWPSQSALAASRQWTGDDSGLWSDPDNWFPVGVPQNGDSLTFPTVGPLDATSMVNDLTGLTVGTMTFTAGGYALNRSGTNVVFTGTDGLPGANYTVLTATNVALPASNWTAIATRLFDAGGGFTFTNTIAPGDPQCFFRLRVP